MISAPVVLRALAPKTADPTELDRLIAAATGMLGRELGRFLGEPAETQELHRGGRSLVLLFDDPVAVGEETEPTVTVEGRAGASLAWEAIEETEYSRDGRRLEHPSCWPQGVRVTYSRGYDLDEGPAELRDLVLEMVLAKVRQRGREGLTSETIGDYSYTKADLTQLDSWTSIAARWRRNRL